MTVFPGVGNTPPEVVVAFVIFKVVGHVPYSMLAGVSSSLRSQSVHSDLFSKVGAVAQFIYDFLCVFVVSE